MYLHNIYLHKANKKLYYQNIRRYINKTINQEKIISNSLKMHSFRYNSQVVWVIEGVEL